MNNPEVIFEAKGHTYHAGDIPYQGVTSLVKKYEPEFKEEFWSLYKAIERCYGSGFVDLKNRVGGFENVVPDFLEKEHILKNAGMIRQIQNDIKREWKKTKQDGLDKGTHIHKLKEKDVITAGGVTYNGHSFRRGNNITQNPLILPDSEDSSNLVFTELLLWNHEYKIAGQADLVLKYGTNINIRDFKTNKKLTWDSFGAETLLYPLNELPNCDISVYTMQLSLYAWMLEQAGYTIQGIELIHCPDPDSKEVPIALTYRPDLVRLLLEDHETTK